MSKIEKLEKISLNLLKSGIKPENAEITYNHDKGFKVIPKKSDKNSYICKNKDNEQKK